MQKVRGHFCMQHQYNTHQYKSGHSAKLRLIGELQLPSLVSATVSLGLIRCSVRFASWQLCFPSNRSDS